MNLLQIFLPLFDRNGKHFLRDHYKMTEGELVKRFKGFTAYSRSPASGLWKDDQAKIQAERARHLRSDHGSIGLALVAKIPGSLEERFQQDQILIRSQNIDVIG